jgi:hypothetical protein
VHPDEYSEWYRDVATNIQAILAANGSYFLNIKEHAEDGERINKQLRYGMALRQLPHCYMALPSTPH